MDLISRLNEFVRFSGLTSSQFADEIGVPRPSFSQILNGRNKKISNELIEKIHHVFPTLNIMWLLFGEGTMNINGETSPSQQIGQTETPTDHNTVQNKPKEYVVTDPVINWINEDSGKMIVKTASGGDGSEFSEQKSNSLFDEKDNAKENSLGDNAARKTLFEQYPSPQGQRSSEENSSGIQKNQNRSPVDKIENKSTDATIDANVNRQNSIPSFAKHEVEIKSIMVYYSDKTYEVFIPEND